MLVGSLVSKTSNFVNFLSQKFFFIFVSLFIFINMVLIFTIKNVFLKNYSILGGKVKFIHNFIVIYLITISLLITILFAEMIVYNSYNIYLIYSLLIIT